MRARTLPRCARQRTRGAQATRRPPRRETALRAVPPDDRAAGLQPAAPQNLPRTRNEGTRTVAALPLEAIERRLCGEHDARGYLVVGVVPDVRRSLLTASPMATPFVPMPVPRFRSASIQGTIALVRAVSDRGAMAAVRNEVRRAEPRLTVFDARTMDELLERFERSIRTAVGPFAGLSLLGLVLATIGSDRRHVLRGRPPARRDLGPAGARRRASPRAVARPSEGTILVVTGALLGAVGRSRSLVRCPPWTPISHRSWVPMSEIPFRSSARRCCSSRWRCSPVRCLPRGQ